MKGEYHDVGVGEAKRAAYPDKIETNGITSCLGIGILNKKDRIGYLGHYVNGVSSPESLIDRAVDEAHDIGDLEVALAGNIPLSRESLEGDVKSFEEALEAYRKHGRWALQMVRSKGIKEGNIRVWFGENPLDNYYFSMTVDTEKNTIKIEIVTDEDET